MSVFRGINVVSLAVPDLAQGRAFYRDVLGFGAPIYDLPDAGWIEFSAGAHGGNLALIPATPDWTPSMTTTLVFNVDDCHAACSALRARGVRCEEPVGFRAM